MCVRGKSTHVGNTTTPAYQPAPTPPQPNPDQESSHPNFSIPSLLPPCPLCTMTSHQASHKPQNTINNDTPSLEKPSPQHALFFPQNTIPISHPSKTNLTQHPSPWLTTSHHTNANKKIKLTTNLSDFTNKIPQKTIPTQIPSSSLHIDPKNFPPLDPQHDYL